MEGQVRGKRRRLLTSGERHMPFVAACTHDSRALHALCAGRPELATCRAHGVGTGRGPLEHRVRPNSPPWSSSPHSLHPSAPRAARTHRLVILQSRAVLVQDLRQGSSEHGQRSQLVVHTHRAGAHPGRTGRGWVGGSAVTREHTHTTAPRHTASDARAFPWATVVVVAEGEHVCGCEGRQGWGVGVHGTEPPRQTRARLRRVHHANREDPPPSFQLP